ncbi:TdeIII family type II restriction endonuclease [Brevibacillus agri]|uniref:TdeIII family type II restriction endonuclease n=1 Tax=Brevibacillus TaxID=55080 RepID=UPI002E2139A8|nr:TdeIII family type II restriction endonuclease [Brevibacillus borstelensis]MED1850063.1 TdeIII family type II restriction endonuclease [Brevibacillus borstelensis]
MNSQTKEAIVDHLINVMDRIIERRCVTEPFNEEEIKLSNPFGFRLVPTEVWKGAKFERSFVTTLGQGIFEQIGKLIAIGSGAEALNQHSITFKVCTWRLEKIDSILSRLRQNKVTPNWQQEVSEILALENDRYEEVTVLSDLYIRRPDGNEEFYSFKTVKPNLDQTERAKRDMLRLIAGNPNNEPYFGLPFNPAGDGNPYRSSGFTIPFKVLDLDKDNCVLIGSELWNKIGNDPHTYEELLVLFEEVGKKVTPKIRRDYFGI